MPSLADHFTVLDNAVIRDVRLTYRARGVLAAVVSHRDGFRITAETLAAESPGEARDAILTALTELEAVGYLRRPRRQDPATGRWFTVWEVYPEGNADTWERVGGTKHDVSAGQPGNGSPDFGSPDFGSPDFGSPEFGSPGTKRSTGEEVPTEKSGQVVVTVTEGDGPPPPTDLTDDDHNDDDEHDDHTPQAMPESLAALRAEAFRDLPLGAVPGDTSDVRDLLAQAVRHGWDGRAIRESITAERHNFDTADRPAAYVVRSLRRIATEPPPSSATDRHAAPEAVCSECSRVQSVCEAAYANGTGGHRFRPRPGAQIVNGRWVMARAADPSPAVGGEKPPTTGGVSVAEARAKLAALRHEAQTADAEV